VSFLYSFKKSFSKMIMEHFTIMCVIDKCKPKLSKLFMEVYSLHLASFIYEGLVNWFGELFCIVEYLL
jgi:hypothetical protein